MAMRTKLRITSVKDEGTTFEQQYMWWRGVLTADPSQCRSGAFLPWSMKNWSKLMLTMENKKAGI